MFPIPVFTTYIFQLLKTLVQYRKNHCRRTYSCMHTCCKISKKYPPLITEKSQCYQVSILYIVPAKLLSTLHPTSIIWPHLPNFMVVQHTSVIILFMMYPHGPSAYNITMVTCPPLTSHLLHPTNTITGIKKKAWIL